MITFTTQSTHHSVTSNGISIGMVYLTREAAETAAEHLNKEWKGKRTFGVKSWEAETFTSHDG
jgi:hypothetical protein